jgi:hypothetical protein
MKYSQLLNYYPNLVCKKHTARTIIKEVLGFSSINCRKDKDCADENNIIYPAINIVGVIGDIVEDNLVDNQYYVNVWNQDVLKFRNGDYDIIEIRESKQIDNYDAIIQRLYRFLINDLSSPKPLNEVIIIIKGNPALSENSLRFLKDKFLRVEIVEN